MVEVATTSGFPQLQARLNAVRGVGTKALMARLALGTVQEAKLLVPRKTGNLGRSIAIESVQATQATIAARAAYAAYVEYGTRAHEIRPRNKKVLAWGGARRLSGSLRTGAQAEFFATLVHHPGTRAKPFLIPGAQKAVATAGVDAIVTAWNEVA